MKDENFTVFELDMLYGELVILQMGLTSHFNIVQETRNTISCVT